MTKTISWKPIASFALGTRSRWTAPWNSAAPILWRSMSKKREPACCPRGNEQQRHLSQLKLYYLFIKFEARSTRFHTMHHSKVHFYLDKKTPHKVRCFFIIVCIFASSIWCKQNLFLKIWRRNMALHRIIDIRCCYKITLKKSMTDSSVVLNGGLAGTKHRQRYCFSLPICVIMKLIKSLALWERWRRSRRRG